MSADSANMVIIDRVPSYLYMQDRVLLPLVTAEEEEKDDPYLVVHPNYLIEV